jgi:YHS domain-containing protein
VFNLSYAQEIKQTQDVTKENTVVKEETKAVFTTICAVSGSELEVTDKTPYSDYNKRRYYFLNQNLKKDFDKAQYKYVLKIVTCEVCGVQQFIKQCNFIQANYEGRGYYVCCSEHKAEFERNPSKYAGKTVLPIIKSEQEVKKGKTEREPLIQVVVLDYKKQDFLMKGSGSEVIKVFPSEGAELIDVIVEIKNISKKEISWLPDKWELIDAKGYSHNPLNKFPRILSKPLQPEFKTKMNLCFELAKGRLPVELNINHEFRKTKAVFPFGNK